MMSMVFFRNAILFQNGRVSLAKMFAILFGFRRNRKIHISKIQYDLPTKTLMEFVTEMIMS